MNVRQLHVVFWNTRGRLTAGAQTKQEKQACHYWIRPAPWLSDNRTTLPEYTHAMNSLNIISGLRSSSPSTPAGSRTSSLGNIKQTQQVDFREDGMDGTQSDQKLSDDEVIYSEDEKAPLVQEEEQGHTEDIPVKSWRLVPKRFADIVVTTIRVVLSTVLSPVTYVVACFYDSEGKFSFMVPVRKLYHLSPTKRRRKHDIASASTTSIQSDESHSSKPRLRPKHPPEESEAGSKPNVKTEQTNENDEPLTDSPAHNTRSRTTPDDSPVAKRSIRIKIQSDATQKKRHSRAKSMNGSGTEDDRLQAVANALKSPSSPAVTKLKYPRAPAPPRPLVPRRQPSYSIMFNPNSPKKTLILDLDETLIHSMAKGGRMSTGHMVEVKFQTPIGAGGMVIGPQVPILYYVHERPHSHEFLRKVCY